MMSLPTLRHWWQQYAGLKLYWRNNFAAMASGKGAMKISSSTYSTSGDSKQTRKPCFFSIMQTTHFGRWT